MLSGWRGAQNSLAFGAGQPVFCDVCCLGQPERSEQDHMAAEMAQARTVLRVMAKQDRLLSAKPWADCDRREARHACYKAVISWQYGGALGAGDRLPHPPPALSPHLALAAPPSPTPCGPSLRPAGVNVATTWLEGGAN